MKRILSGMLAAALVLSAAGFAACSPENAGLSRDPDRTVTEHPDPQEPDKGSDPTAGTSDGISAEQEREIVCAWLNEHPQSGVTAEELSLNVRGIFDDTYVFYLVGPFGASAVITDVIVDNILFEYPSSDTLEVYHGGRFYTLETAYENGLLTRSDLLALQKNYNNGWDWSTSQLIKEDYVREHGGVNAEDVSLRVFYRWSMERCVLFVDDGADYPAVITEQEVDGVTFCYGSAQQLMYYGDVDGTDSRFCDLETAFARGCLSHDDLLAVQYNYENGIQIVLP